MTHTPMWDTTHTEIHTSTCRCLAAAQLKGTQPFKSSSLLPFFSPYYITESFCLSPAIKLKPHYCYRDTLSFTSSASGHWRPFKVAYYELQLNCVCVVRIRDVRFSTAAPVVSSIRLLARAPLVQQDPAGLQANCKQVAVENTQTHKLSSNPKAMA